MMSLLRIVVGIILGVFIGTVIIFLVGTVAWFVARFVGPWSLAWIRFLDSLLM